MTGSEYFRAAVKVVSDKLESIRKVNGDDAKFLEFVERFEKIQSEPSDDTITDLRELYIDLWQNYFDEEDIFEIIPRYRVAIQAALDTTDDLVKSGKLSSDLATKVNSHTFTAIFYSQIVDSKNTIRSLNDAFILITNLDPVKVVREQPLTFVQLENLLLNLMKKPSPILSKQLQEEIAFILARGTGPLFSDELEDTVDLLSKARFLDAILRKNDPLYNIVKIEWDTVWPSIKKADTIEKFIAQKDRVDRLHEATLLLRNLDKVDRFISSDREENSELANIIKPDWDKLQSKLQLATSVNDILNSRQEILEMKSVVEISFRISKTIELSRQSNLNSGMTSTLEELLERVENAQSVSEILLIVAEFDKSLNDLRQKRNPLSSLKFDYETMKTRAEIQADYENLVIINRVLKIIDTAEKIAEGNPTVSKIDRIEVLLTWASQKAPVIKADLSSYTKDVYKIKASDILQRAKSLENLVFLGERSHRFLPGYTDFTATVRDKINDVRELVIARDLDPADAIIRQLFEDWQQVTQAYTDDPFGSPVGYSVTELDKIDRHKILDALSNMASVFFNSNFRTYSNQFVRMTDQTSQLIEQGNYAAADSKLAEMTQFLIDKLPLKDKRIIFEISHDNENDIWLMEGFVDKSRQGVRETLHLTVYDMNGDFYSKLKFSDTVHGEFYTHWKAPTEPGIYVVMLQYQNVRASQIVQVGDIIPITSIGAPGQIPSSPEGTRTFSIFTNKLPYSTGDTIIISGNVKSLLYEAKVNIQILDPSSTRVEITQKDVARDGSFTHTVFAAGPLWKQNGEYKVLASYGPTQSKETTFLFNAKSTIPSSPVSTTRVSIPEGTSVPGCEETNQCWNPSTISVRVGNTVTWSNDDTAAHTVTSGTSEGGPNGVFDSSLFMAGTTFEHTFSQSGTYDYFCMVHPWMKGVVIVR